MSTQARWLIMVPDVCAFLALFVWYLRNPHRRAPVEDRSAEIDALLAPYTQRDEDIYPA